MRSPAPFLLILFLALTTTVRAADQSGESFAAGVAAFNAQDYARALVLFQAALDAGLEGPAVHYNIAVASYKLGHYRRAETEFGLIADRYPAMRGLAEYNLGLVAEKLGNPQAAQRHFRRAARTAEDAKVRTLAERRLRPERSSKPIWYSSFNTRVGHDDNVRLLSSDVLAQNGLAAASDSTEITAIVSGPLSSGPGLRFDGSFYAVRYSDASFFDQDFLGLGLAYQWRAGRWLAEVGPHLTDSTLDGDGYEQRTGIGVRVRRNVTSTTTFGIRYSYDDVNSGAARFAYVEGSRDWLELRVDHRGDQSRLTARYSIESNDRSVDFASRRDQVSLLYRYDFSDRWRADVRGSLRRSDYRDATVPRTENLKEMGLDVTRALPNKWEINASLANFRNSSVNPYSYTRTRLTVGFTKSFY